VKLKASKPEWGTASSTRRPPPQCARDSLSSDQSRKTRTVLSKANGAICFDYLRDRC
jgi:hypothetical protein